MRLLLSQITAAALLAELYAAVGDDDNVAAIEELTVAFKAERKKFEAAK